ncbi:MAG: hypothetical protein E4H08_09000 [Candidatus Atribacteria bacterium]|jgi:hypothetical protein|nr:MAG: hypothetical protein E4H08_09000 [Candidatus Atribacteria bacterium]
MVDAERIRLTTIGRSIDLHYPTNLAIVLLTLVTFAVGLVTTLLFRGGSFLASAFTSLGWAGAVFLSWALARELDPDRWYSAFFATVGGLAAASMYSPPALLMIFWFLIALRFINRSTGHPPGVLDVAGFVAISAWLGWTSHWAFPLLAVPALLLAGRSLRPARTQLLVAGAIAALGIALGIVRGWTLMPFDPAKSLFDLRIIAAITLASTLVIRSLQNVTSKADRTGDPLNPCRVQWALTWSLSVGIALTFVAGISVKEVSPLWAALAGTILGWGFERLHALAKRRSSR